MSYPGPDQSTETNADRLISLVVFPAATEAEATLFSVSYSNKSEKTTVETSS